MRGAERSNTEEWTSLFSSWGDILLACVAHLLLGLKNSFGMRTKSKVVLEEEMRN